MTIDPPPADNLSRRLMGVRTLTIAQRLITLDDAWTAELGTAARAFGPEATEPLRGLVSELREGLGEIRPRAVAVGEVLSGLADTEFEAAVSALDNALRRENRPGFPPSGFEPGRSSRAAMIAACNYVNAHAENEAALIQADLDELDRGGSPNGAFRSPYKCALLLLILGAGVVATIGVGGPAGFVAVAVVSQCGSSLLAWQDAHCPSFLPTLNAEPQAPAMPIVLATGRPGQGGDVEFIKAMIEWTKDDVRQVQLRVSAELAVAVIYVTQLPFWRLAALKQMWLLLGGLGLLLAAALLHFLYLSRVHRSSRDLTILLRRNDGTKAERTWEDTWRSWKWLFGLGDVLATIGLIALGVVLALLL